MITKFHDRREAGRLLAEKLEAYRDKPGTLVLALPRGGVPVAYEVAAALNLPMDVFVVRKLGAPFQPELAMGAIAEGGARVLNGQVIASMGISPEVIESVAAEERKELNRRVRAYRGTRAAPAIKGKTVLLVDDGLATGASMLAAIRYVDVSRPARVGIAVPVASVQAFLHLKGIVSDCICLATPEPFHAVGAWYDDFSQVTDDEVQRVIEESHPAELAGKTSAGSSRFTA